MSNKGKLLLLGVLLLVAGIGGLILGFMTEMAVATHSGSFVGQLNMYGNPQYRTQMFEAAKQAKLYETLGGISAVSGALLLIVSFFLKKPKIPEKSGEAPAST